MFFFLTPPPGSLFTAILGWEARRQLQQAKKAVPDEHVLRISEHEVQTAGRAVRNGISTHKTGKQGEKLGGGLPISNWNLDPLPGSYISVCCFRISRASEISAIIFN